MTAIFAIAGVVIKELYRRKDFYVLFILTVLVTGVMALANFFDDDKMVGYLKEICLLLIWISALAIAVATAARQIPAERENRTIFPLLAKPVTRGRVITGKFLGCWLASGLSLIMFYGFLGVVSASRDHHFPAVNYFQAMWLQWVFLAVVIAMVILGSIVFAAPSSNATICVIAVAGMLFMGRYLKMIALTQPEPVRSILYTLYFVMPHLEWFDVRELVIHGRGLVPWVDCGLATLYGAAYTAVFLFAAWICFRRKALN